MRPWRPIPGLLLSAVAALGCSAPALNALRASTGLAPPSFPPPTVEEEVAVGVTLLRFEPPSYGGGPQRVHVIGVDGLGESAQLRILRANAGKVRVDRIAEGTSAVVAVNAGYFDSAGAPMGYLKIGGQELATQPAQRPPRGVVGWNPGEKLQFRTLASGDRWDAVSEALGAGPMLIQAGRRAERFEQEGFADPKFLGPNPRTAIGQTADGRLLLVTVDGRSPTAAGLSLADLARLMEELGCVDALNLDGGGSTTTWVRDFPEPIVNVPSDSGGARAVANVLVVDAPDVIAYDDDDPGHGWTTQPTWAWRRASHETAYRGDLWLGEGVGAYAEWRLGTPSIPGRYAVEARVPNDPRVGRLTFSAGRDGAPRASVDVDPRTQGGRWVRIGAFDFAPQAAELRVRVASTGGALVAADAVRLVRLP
ncbi:MAG: phosphodiester glycosidase family protein [Planctomycetes bacterium]|nr:phosphodiester glycosidase family protein [Planctomycetota bacterium]